MNSAVLDKFTSHLSQLTRYGVVGLVVNYALAIKFVFKESKLTNKRAEFLIFLLSQTQLLTITSIGCAKNPIACQKSIMCFTG